MLPSNVKVLEDLYRKTGEQLEAWERAADQFAAAYRQFEKDLASRAAVRGEYRLAMGAPSFAWLGNDDAAAKRLPNPRVLFACDPEVARHLPGDKFAIALGVLEDVHSNALDLSLIGRAYETVRRVSEVLVGLAQDLRLEIIEQMARNGSPAVAGVARLEIAARKLSETEKSIFPAMPRCGAVQSEVQRGAKFGKPGVTRSTPTTKPVDTPTPTTTARVLRALKRHHRIDGWQWGNSLPASITALSGTRNISEPTISRNSVYKVLDFLFGGRSGSGYRIACKDGSAKMMILDALKKYVAGR